jgi:hypothetical protein
VILSCITCTLVLLQLDSLPISDKEKAEMSGSVQQVSEAVSERLCGLIVILASRSQLWLLLFIVLALVSATLLPLQPSS